MLLIRTSSLVRCLSSFLSSFHIITVLALPCLAFSIFSPLIFFFFTLPFPSPPFLKLATLPFSSAPFAFPSLPLRFAVEGSKHLGAILHHHCAFLTRTLAVDVVACAILASSWGAPERHIFNNMAPRTQFHPKEEGPSKNGSLRKPSCEQLGKS